MIENNFFTLFFMSYLLIFLHPNWKVPKREYNLQNHTNRPTLPNPLHLPTQPHLPKNVKRANLLSLSRNASMTRQNETKAPLSVHVCNTSASWNRALFKSQRYSSHAKGHFSRRSICISISADPPEPDTIRACPTE